MTVNTITLIKPDDWHIHLRDGDMLEETVPATAKHFARAIVMPNLVPPVATADQALAYKKRIMAHAPNGSDFEPLMTLYLTPNTTPQTIIEAKEKGVTAVKLYPAGATTNSSSGVSTLLSAYPVFEQMAASDMPLLIHGEVTDHDCDIYDREKRFIDEHLNAIHEAIPSLRIVFEHITTRDAVEFVQSCDTNVAATITPQHLMYNRNDLLVGGIKPHLYCLPVLKRNIHQIALQEAVASGDARFFLGTDSAPHERHTKESSCGCAGCYSAPMAIELYAEIFDTLGIIDKLEAFASFNGPDFYRLPRNTETIELIKDAWMIPEEIKLKGNDSLVPLGAGLELKWRVKA